MADGGRIAGPKCIALTGPFASGKTTLLEAILARTGEITRQGTTAEKNTVGDASVRSCTTAKIKGWRFLSEGAEESSEVTFSVSFTGN